MPLKRKEPDTPRNDSNTNKIPTYDPNLTGPERMQVTQMAQVCSRAIRLFRHIDWTTYARQSHSLVQHNFGNGLEPAVRCFGCMRILPPVLITGDHIAPKSDILGLRRSIAYGFDRLDSVMYVRVLAMKLATIRNDPIALDITVIKQYDDGLPDDVRNIQPLCWYCNTKKGTRVNTRLFPDNAVLPRAPHEAPF